jgi:hypothetical protein
MKLQINLDDLIAWLQHQDPNATYDYGQPASCLIYQYLKAKGVGVISVGTTDFSYLDENADQHDAPLPSSLDAVARGPDEGGRTQTYGDALRRAKLLAVKREIQTVRMTKWLKGAEEAHAEYEKTLGHRDDNWAAWYAQWIVAQQ